MEGVQFTTLALIAILYVVGVIALVFVFQPELTASLSLGAISMAIDETFGPPLKAFFHPIDRALAPVYMPWARVVALGFFIGTMVWVFVGLRRGYVNLEAPSKRFYHDLRFWTIASMLPHVIVYFYF